MIMCVGDEAVSSLRQEALKTLFHTFFFSQGQDKTLS